MLPTAETWKPLVSFVTVRLDTENWLSATLNELT